MQFWAWKQQSGPGRRPPSACHRCDFDLQTTTVRCWNNQRSSMNHRYELQDWRTPSGFPKSADLRHLCWKCLSILIYRNKTTTRLKTVCVPACCYAPLKEVEVHAWRGTILVKGALTRQLHDSRPGAVAFVCGASQILLKKHERLECTDLRCKMM